MFSFKSRAILCTGGVLLIALLATTIPAPAAEFHLVDSTVSGAWIGEADGVMHVLTGEGKRVKIDGNDLVWIDWSVEVPKAIEKRVFRERERFLKERRNVARKLIRTLERAAEAERPSLIAQFDGFDEAQSLHAFSDGLESRTDHVRELSFARLSKFHSEAAVVPFVRVYLKSPDPEYAARMLAQARAMDPDLTRRLFEFVAQTAPIEHRVKAVETLGSMGSRDALPSLVRVLQYVTVNIRATLGRTKSIDEVEINLGGTTTAAQGVTIDLPQLELIQVNSSLQIPAESLRRLRTATVQSLESISGASHGQDVRAWAKLVRNERAAAAKSGEKKSD